MITVTDNFISEVFEKDNRSYQYKAVVTFTDNTSITIDNDNLVDSGGVVIDEAVSNDDSLDIGSCIINKMTLTLRNYDGEFDEYDFRGAGVILWVGLKINGTLEEFRRGAYIIKEIPVYEPNTITLTCYDYMVLFDEVLVKEVSTLYGNSVTTALAVAACCTKVSVSAYNIAAFSGSPMISIPEDDAMTLRDLLSYIAQMNAGNFKFVMDGADSKLAFTWYASGFTTESYAIRQIATDYVREVSDNVIRVSFHIPEGEVIWANQSNIPSLYSLKADKHDTEVTGVRIVLNNGSVDSEDGIIDATTYVTGTDDYQISVENNPLITSTNATTVLATLANRLIGFKYRQASFSHPGMPWIEAGDSAVIRDANGTRHNVLISSTVFTSLDRQSTVSSGIPNAFNVPSRFSAETKAYVRMMEDVKPVVNTINQRIANASGLYETTQYNSGSSGAAIYYLHDKADLADSDLQIMFSDQGILLSPNARDPQADWFGLCANGDMLANILSANGINADWINTGAITVKDQNDNILFQISVDDKKMILSDNGENYGDSTFKIFRTADGENRYAEIFSDALFLHDGYESLGLQESGIYPGGFVFDQHDNSNGNIPSSYDDAVYSVIFGRGKFQVVRSFEGDGLFPIKKTLFEVDAIGETIKANEISIKPSTPTFTASQNVNVSQQSWSRIGNIVVGDLTLSGVTVGSSTVVLGTLNAAPAHTVIGNARTASVVARCSINSSGEIQINSGTSISSTTTIYLSFSFVAS